MAECIKVIDCLSSVNSCIKHVKVLWIPNYANYKNVDKMCHQFDETFKKYLHDCENNFDMCTVLYRYSTVLCTVPVQLIKT